MILIDSSQGSKDLINYPPLNDPSIACLTSLSLSSTTKSSADICFTGNGPQGRVMIGMEIKELGELISSIHSGRIQDTQIPALRSEYDICWLIYYGPYRCGEDDNLETPLKRQSSIIWKPYTFIGNKPIKYGYLESSLLSYHEAGISHKHFYSKPQAAKWIACLYRWWSKQYSDHKSFRVFDRSSDNRRPAIMPGTDPHTRLLMEFADRIPGIDYKRSYAIATHFDSVQDMANAGIDEWIKIPGIGKVLARVAVETMNKKRGTGNNTDKHAFTRTSPRLPTTDLSD